MLDQFDGSIGLRREEIKAPRQDLLPPQSVPDRGCVRAIDLAAIHDRARLVHLHAVFVHERASDRHSARGNEDAAMREQLLAARASVMAHTAAGRRDKWTGQ